MTAAHLHLALNHFPIIGGILASLLVLLALARKDKAVLRAAMLTFFLVGAFAVPVYLSGEPAEEVVEELAGVSHDAIEEHEDAALWAFVSLGIAGAIALAGLVGYRGKPLPRWYGPLLAITGVGATLVTLWTANLGGKVHHQELRSGFSPPVEQEMHEDDG